uniref:Uncharacterized protein n=1 Tax=viral metagenome TaxID=1070528 RepID=A0A6C0DRG3_9ZZZZ
MTKPGVNFTPGKIFLLFLLITMAISFYIFVQAIFYNSEPHKLLYSTWQFPMLFALFMESVLLEYKA